MNKKNYYSNIDKSLTSMFYNGFTSVGFDKNSCFEMPKKDFNDLKKLIAKDKIKEIYIDFPKDIQDKLREYDGLKKNIIFLRNIIEHLIKGEED